MIERDGPPAKRLDGSSISVWRSVPLLFKPIFQEFFLAAVVVFFEECCKGVGVHMFVLVLFVVSRQEFQCFRTSSMILEVVIEQIRSFSIYSRDVVILKLIQRSVQELFRLHRIQHLIRKGKRFSLVLICICEIIGG